jgi:hypothetical protein
MSGRRKSRFREAFSGSSCTGICEPLNSLGAAAGPRLREGRLLDSGSPPIGSRAGFDSGSSRTGVGEPVSGLGTAPTPDSASRSADRGRSGSAAERTMPRADTPMRETADTPQGEAGGRRRMRRPDMSPSGKHPHRALSGEAASTHPGSRRRDGRCARPTWPTRRCARRAETPMC